MIKDRIDIKCLMADGTVLVTGFNGTYLQAVAYYLNQPYTHSDETTTTVVRVTEI